MKSLALILLGAVALAHAPPALAQQAPAIRRFALIAGSNDGGAGRVKLRYATTDAQAVSKVLDELGGVTSADRVLLLDPDRAAFERALETLRAHVARSPGAGRSEVLLYYSGHSDEEGLLLGGDRLTYAQLRKAIDAVPADVRIVILDSCSSGALTRRKGGVRRPQFLVDASGKIRGHAFLTSSSADEAAQESDRVGGSFFTHFLVSGLRGAADSTRDGRVTLSEAYQFAFQETLMRTERTQSGAQHPAYDIQLAGTGDSVMTDLHQTSAGLLLSRELDGRLYVRDGTGRLVVELQKLPSHAVELGLEPGRYRVTVDRQGQLYGLELTVAQGRRTRLAASELEPISAELAVARGNLPPEAQVATDDRAGMIMIPFNISIMPTVSLNGANGDRAINRFSLNLVGHSARLEGLELGIGANWVRQDVHGAQLVSGANLVGRDLHGAQVAGFVNIVQRNTRGAQIAAGVNYTSGTMRGAQVSYLTNWAEQITGAQVALVNVGGEVEGAQIGLVNVARGKVRGLQLGLVNVADDVEGAPIGLVSWVKKGQHHLEVWGSDTALTNVGVKLGSKYVYSILQAGIQPIASKTRWTAGIGLGGHLPITESVFVDVDLSINAVGRDSEVEEDGGISKLRAMLGYKLSSFALFAGPELNAYSSTKNDGSDFGIGPQLTRFDGKRHVRLWPGFVLGLQL